MATTVTPTVRPRPWGNVHITSWIITAVLALMTIRLAGFVNHYAVNIVYWDQWDFLQGLFDDADAWSLFRWQHGPQRQGLGNLITAALYRATAWNGRVDAAATAVVMLLSTMVGLWLVKRVCGSLRPWDVIVPLIFLTTSSAETYVVATNLAHGPLPALLVTAYALALTIRSHAARCGTLVVLNFFAVNTGFTVFLGGITLLLLLLLACAPHLTIRDRAIYGAGIAAGVGTLVLFFHGFVPLSATTCFQFPHARPWEYVPYTGFVLARPFGFIAGESVSQLLVGTGVAIVMTGFVLHAGMRLVQSRGDSAFWAATFSLAGFALLFAAGTAVGRICLEFASANASRYIPYMLPGMLALYLVIRRSAATSPVAYALLPVLLVACIAKETDETSRKEAETYFRYKQRWRDCYLATHDIAACDVSSGHPVYPSPEVTQLQQKLDWLEQHRYSLFQPRDRLAGTE
jgi:hypothetical protein